jgi:hypothetical protein
LDDMYQIAMDTQREAGPRISYQPREWRRWQDRSIPKEKGQQKCRSEEEFQSDDQNWIKRVLL